MRKNAEKGNELWLAALFCLITPTCCILYPSAPTAHTPADHAESGDTEAAVRRFLEVIVGVGVLPLLPPDRKAVVLENAATLLPMLRTYYDSPEITEKQLSALQTPILLVTGEFSPRIARLSTDALHRRLPNSRVEVLEVASHGLQMENPYGFNRMVLGFLEEVERVAA